MSCKVGNRAHHERCQKYKQRGQRELNKVKKQEKNQKRIAKFAAKREKKEPHTYVPKDPETRGSNKTEPLGSFPWRPKMDRMIEVQKWTSIMRRVQNNIDAEREEVKKALEKENKKKGSKNVGRKNDAEISSE